jgi:hypothetical protein
MAVELPIGADYEGADIDDLQETVYLRGDDLDRLRKQHGLKDLGYAYEDYSELRKTALIKKLREMDAEINRLNGNAPEPQPVPAPLSSMPVQPSRPQPPAPVSHPVIPPPQPTPVSDSRQTEIDRLSSTIQELRVSENALKEQISAKNAELEQTKNKYSMLAAEVQKLRDAQQEMPAAEEYRTLKAENEELSSDLRIKERALSREKSRNAQLEEELNNLQNRMHRNPSAEVYGKLQDDFLNLQEKLKAAEQKNVRLEAELEEQKRECVRQKSKLAEEKDVSSSLKGSVGKDSRPETYKTSMTSHCDSPSGQIGVGSLFESPQKKTQPDKKTINTAGNKRSGDGMLGAAFQ